MDLVPQVMKVIRQEMRQASAQQLSVPQFRTLNFLGRHRGASLNAVSAHLGVTAATASAMVERLVRRELVHREANPEERRRVRLLLTRAGSEVLETCRGRARDHFTIRLDGLPEPDRKRLMEGLNLLRQVLAEDLEKLLP